MDGRPGTRTSQSNEPATSAAGKLELETPDCPLCGASERTVRFRFEPYRIVRCARCGVHYLSPRLAEAAMLELYRTDEYFEGGDVGYASYTALEPALRATFRRLVRQLRRRGFGGDLLDLGCGYGFLLEEARSTFRSATGTEFSERAAAVARARGLKVVTGGLHDLPAGSRFDCIVASHVVEHLYDPVAVLPTILARLRPGGSLVVATPDMGSAWRRLLGARWPSFKVPEHVLYLDRDALGRLLAGAGFVAVRPMPFRHAFPLGLVVERAGLAPIARRLGRIARVPVWLPGTTVAAVGRRPAATDSAPAGPEPGAR